MFYLEWCIKPPAIAAAACLNGELLRSLEPYPFPWDGWWDGVQGGRAQFCQHPPACGVPWHPRVLPAPALPPAPSLSSPLPFSPSSSVSLSSRHVTHEPWSIWAKTLSFNPLVTIRNMLTKPAVLADGEAMKSRSLDAEYRLFRDWKTSLNRQSGSPMANYVYKEILHCLSPNSV